MESFIKNWCETLYFFDEDLDVRSTFCFVEADFTSLQKKAKDFLHPKELAVLERFPSEKRKHSYLLGRYAAKQALTYYSNPISPLDILIKSGGFQQPVIYSSVRENIQVSFSHCGQRAVAITFPETHPMGIDLEVSDPNQDALIETQLTLQEKNILSTINHSSFPQLFMVFWTVKEALSKALRTGFTSPLEIYEIGKLQLEKNLWISEFRHFTQYRGYSFSFGDLICSLVYPKFLHLIVNNFQMKIEEYFFREGEKVTQKIKTT